jgi:integrase
VSVFRGPVDDAQGTKARERKATSSEAIKVRIFNYPDRKNLVMRYDDPITGKPVTRSAGTDDETTAIGNAAVWQDELNSGRYQAASKVTWESFVERYTQEKLASLAPKTILAAGIALGHLKRAIDPDRLVKATSAMMSRFQSKMRTEGMKDSTLAKNLRHIRAALSWAVSVGMLAAVPDMHMPKRVKGQTMMKGRPITGEEFDRMLAAIPAALVEVSQRQRKKEPKRPVKHKVKVIPPAMAAAWRHYLTGLWLSGLRLEESVILSWDEEAPFSIDLTGRRPAFRILAEAQKSGRDEVLPMTPDFAEFILQTPAAERVGLVFRPVIREGSDPMSPAKVGVVVAAIGKAAKVVTDKAAGKFATAHDFRRSFGNRWAKRVSSAVLKRLMRHSSIQTTEKYYVNLDAAEVADELWAKFSSSEGNNAAQGNILGNIDPKNVSGPGDAEPVKPYLARG